MANKVFYHSGCPDGFLSSWIAKQAFDYNYVIKGEDGDNEYIPISYDDVEKYRNKILETCKDNNVYILDFSFPKDLIEQVAEISKKMVLLDHHKTAKANLQELIDSKRFSDKTNKNYIRFDMDHCGAYLTHQYFHEGQNYGRSILVPRIIEYVQDRDLWKWELPESKEVNAAISSFEYDYEVWNDLMRIRIADLVTQGTSILRFQKQMVIRALAHVHVIKVDDSNGNASTFDAINSSILQSDIAHAFLESQEHSDIVAVYYITKELSGNLVRVSLRSKLTDVSDIAKKFGGGGHKHAAGFSVKPTLVLGI